MKFRSANKWQVIAFIVLTIAITLYGIYSFSGIAALKTISTILWLLGVMIGVKGFKTTKNEHT